MFSNNGFWLNCMVMFAVLINGEFLLLWTRGRLNGAYYKDLSAKSRLKQYGIPVNAMILAELRFTAVMTLIAHNFVTRNLRPLILPSDKILKAWRATAASTAT